MSVVGVKWTYNTRDADPPLNEVRGSCAACRKRHNHQRGFVVVLSDDQLATIGHHCGKTKHHLEYREHLAAFEDRRKRHRILQRVIAAFGRVDELAAAATTCRNDAGCRALLAARRSFTQSFPALWKLLEENRDGRLHATIAQRDYDAERERDSRYDAKLDALARRRGLSRDNREHEAQLVAELAGDPDASKEPITRPVRRETGQYRGAAFISGIYRAEQQLTDLYHRALHALDDVDGKDTGTLTAARLDAAAKRFTQVVRDQLKLQDDLAAAAAFLDAANLASIGRWISQSPRWRAQIGTLTVRDGLLRLGAASLSIALPEFQFAGLTQILAEVSGDG